MHSYRSRFVIYIDLFLHEMWLRTGLLHVLVRKSRSQPLSMMKFVSFNGLKRQQYVRSKDTLKMSIRFTGANRYVSLVFLNDVAFYHTRISNIIVETMRP